MSRTFGKEEREEKGECFVFPGVTEKSSSTLIVDIFCYPKLHQIVYVAMKVCFPCECTEK